MKWSITLFSLFGLMWSHTINFFGKIKWWQNLVQKHLLPLRETLCSRIEGINVNGKGVPWCHGEHSGLWIQWSKLKSLWEFSIWASLVAQLCGRSGFDPWVGKILWRGKGYPLQYSGLENSMDSIVHGVAKSRTRLSDFQCQWTKPFLPY